MSLIQRRMSIDRSLMWAKIITLVGALLGVGNLIYILTMPGSWGIWTIGLTGYFLAMTIYGAFLWRRARVKLERFEAENGRDAGRQD